MADVASCARTAGALLVVSHDLELLDQAITHVLHLDEASSSSTGHVLAVPRRRGEGRGTAAQASRPRQQAEIRRLSHARRLDAAPEREARPHAKSLDTRVEHARRRRRSTPIRAARHRRGTASPTATALGRDRARGRRPREGASATARSVRDVTFDVGRGERLLVLGLNGAGKTTLLRDPRRHRAADARRDRASGTGVSVGYYAQEHEGITRGRGGARPPARRRARRPRPSAAALLGMFGLTRRPRVPGRGHALGRREDEARARAARRRRATTCCCSTSRPTTSTRRRGPRSAPRCASGRARSCS